MFILLKQLINRKGLRLIAGEYFLAERTDVKLNPFEQYNIVLVAKDLSAKNIGNEVFPGANGNVKNILSCPILNPSTLGECLNRQSYKFLSHNKKIEFNCYQDWLDKAASYRY